MNKYKLYYCELKHWLKYFGHKNPPKSPVGTYNTIMGFKFGLENYTFKKGKFARKKK